MHHIAVSFNVFKFVACLLSVGVVSAADKSEGEVRELSVRAAQAVGQKNWVEAREIYEKILQAAPNQAATLANLGTVEYYLHDLDQAVIHLDKAVRLDPRLNQAWLTLGIVHYERKEWWLSLSALSRAVAGEPDNPRIHNYLAATLKGLQWDVAAEASLQRALDLDPSYAEANFNLALLYLERRPPSPELARRHYLRAVEYGSTRDELVEKQLKELADGEINNPETSAGASSSSQSDPPAAPLKKAAPPSRSQIKE